MRDILHCVGYFKAEIPVSFETKEILQCTYDLVNHLEEEVACFPQWQKDTNEAA